ncbi:PDZ domain-containing protein [Botrimarina mediterranea]|uniref:Uncharacterized protein n=1 Tax=Botrimarina mediterranea TaxID=2528022 RepID=A0A518K5W2_9BACT|nr:PDZ domain-containing protein [Botrimarina mediterranea]QDV73184.1 hypothetical protein Spa11_13780 [Botrimarina mediterranea]QDV77757.1 hypothetical protein K2D_13600 [Planctomycetes bacterium K2D]
MKSLLAVAAVAFLPAVASAQQAAPAPQYGVPINSVEARDAALARLKRGEVYESQRWRASFHLDEALLLPQFQGLAFAGARIVKIDEDSPLDRLGLKVGDVVTRLDGTKIDTGRWPNQEGCYWMLPQFERHYGLTTVRFIRAGTTQVVDQTVDLGDRCKPQRFPQMPGNVILP